MDNSFSQLMKKGNDWYTIEILEVWKRYGVKFDDTLRFDTIRHKQFAFHAGNWYILYMAGCIILPTISKYIFAGIKFYTGV